MNNSILSMVKRKLNQSQIESESSSDDFEMINIRPGNKIASMIEILSKLSGETPSAMISVDFSKHLAQYILNLENGDEILLALLEKRIKHTNEITDLSAHASTSDLKIQENSALDILLNKKVFRLGDKKLSYQDSFSKRVNLYK